MIPYRHRNRVLKSKTINIYSAKVASSLHDKSLSKYCYLSKKSVMQKDAERILDKFIKAHEDFFKKTFLNAVFGLPNF